MSGFKRLAMSALGVALLVGGMAVPASAGTDSGSIYCNSSARVSVRGEQQTLAWLTLNVSGATVYSKGNAYVGYGHHSGYGTRSWSGTSDSLLWSGTYGYCRPL